MDRDLPGELARLPAIPLTPSTRFVRPLALGSLTLALLTLHACTDRTDRRGTEATRAAPAPTPERPTESTEVVLNFGVVGRVEPRLTVAGSQPLVDYLTEETRYRIELRIGRSTEEVELEAGMQDLVTFLEERLVEIAPLGVLSYCLADDRFGAVALVQTLNHEGQAVDRAVFFTAESGEITKLDGLVGKSVAVGPSHSTASHVMALHELDEAQIAPEDFAEMRRLENNDAVVQAVRDERFDAGVVSERVLERAGSDGLRVFHRSEPIPSPPLVVRADLPEPVQSSLRKALLDLDETSAKWDELFRNGFAPPNESDYDAVRKILNEQSPRCTVGCHEPVSFEVEQ